MKTFTIDIHTEFDSYTIDLKPNGQYCLISKGSGAYYPTLQDAMAQIEYYYDQELDRAIEQANQAI
jgi:hypothetical protein